MTQPYTAADVEVAELALCRTRFWLVAMERSVMSEDDLAESARAVLSALAAAGRLAPAEGQPDVWEYGRPDPDEPDGLMTFDGTPRVITPRMVRRPLRAVGPWLPVPEEDSDAHTS